MDRVVAARKLVAELVKSEQIEVRRAEIVGRDLANLVESLGRPPSGQELEEWLDEHAQVTELYASAGLLEELVYRHLTPPAPEPAAAVEARHPELEKQIRDAPLVYADWLQEQGDPFGEWIALGVKATTGTDDDRARFERHMKQHEARFLGGIAKRFTEHVVLHWRNGLVRAIEERSDVYKGLADADWKTLLGLRVCEHVESLTLRRAMGPELESLIDAMPVLREVVLESCTGSERVLSRALSSLTIAGHRIALQRADVFSPSLERLEIRAVQVFCSGSLEIPAREFVVLVNDFSFDVISRARLARVERLTLVLGNAIASRAVELLEAVELPALVSLTVRDGLLDLKAYKALAKLPFIERLTGLGLVNLELDDELIAKFARTKLPSLAEIDLSYNELSRDGLEAAKKLAPTVISHRQHKRGSAAEKRIRRFAGTRLQVAEEIADPKYWKKSGVDGDVRWARYEGNEQYELFVTTDLNRYGCSCPSSIQPCKHVVALALVAERDGLVEASSNGIENRVGGNEIE